MAESTDEAVDDEVVDMADDDELGAAAAATKGSRHSDPTDVSSSSLSQPNSPGARIDDARHTRAICNIFFLVDARLDNWFCFVLW